MGETLHLTVAQATVKFLSQQYSESDGVEYKFFEGCFGIFGHGNVAGLGQALLQAEIDEPGALPYVLGRNEQAMVHSAVAFARMRNRLQTYAVSSSVGPGATNMVTGAALATINRIPVPNVIVYIPGDPSATLPTIFTGVAANNPASCGRCWTRPRPHCHLRRWELRGLHHWIRRRPMELRRSRGPRRSKSRRGLRSVHCRLDHRARRPGTPAACPVLLR